MDNEKKKEDPMIVYEYLILQHAALKCILDKKYDILMNVNIYDKFILKHLKRRYLQYALVALVRAGMVLANQEILMAFIVRRNNWLRNKKAMKAEKQSNKKGSSKMCKNQQAWPSMDKCQKRWLNNYLIKYQG